MCSVFHLHSEKPNYCVHCMKIFKMCLQFVLLAALLVVLTVIVMILSVLSVSSLMCPSFHQKKSGGRCFSSTFSQYFASYNGAKNVQKRSKLLLFGLSWNGHFCI